MAMEPRRIGVAVDFSANSKNALRWALDNIVKPHDHLIILIVNKEDIEGGSSELWRDSGSPLVPLYEFEEPGVAMKYGVQTLDVELFSALEAASREKKLVVVMKVYWGDPRDKLSYAIDHVPLDHIVAGNRGLGKMQRLLLGSVSSYLVNNAPCPVTVVKLPAVAAPS